MHITFCLPKPWGDEDKSFMNIIGLSEVPIVWRDVSWDHVQQRIGDKMDPQLYFDLRDHIYADFNYRLTDDLGCIEFSGRYPDNLYDEINNYSIVAGVVPASRSTTSFTRTTGSPILPASTPSRCRANPWSSMSTPQSSTAAAENPTPPSTASKRTAWTTPTASCA